MTETDIVERLRAQYDYSLCQEAADEIERERKAHLELAASYHDATEEIERLRKALELQKQASRDVAATYNEQEAEIERLEHMQANLHGHIKRLEDENSKLREQIDHEIKVGCECEAENAKLREALETCASELEHEIRASYDEKYCGHPAMDRRLERDLQSVRDARTALQKDEGE